MTQLLRKVLILASILVALAACNPKKAPVTEATQTPSVAEATPTPAAAADASWEKVKSNGKIVVGISADYPPFSYYDENYALDGFDVALMKGIGEKLGVSVEFKDMAFEGLVGALQSGQIDAAISAISVTDRRRAQMDFSQVYFVSADAILSAQDSTIQAIRTIDEIANYHTGVERSTIYESWLQANLVDTGKMPKENLLAYTSLDQEIKDLSQKRIDIAVMDLQPAKALVKQKGLRLIGEDLNRQQYAVALLPGNNALLAEINDALNQLQADKAVAELAKKYLDLNQEDILPTPQPQPTQVIPTPPAPSGCYDSMAFAADLTLPDNNMRKPPLVPAGSIFTKGWRLKNTGTCTWNTGYALVFSSTTDPFGVMKAGPVYVKGTVPPGGTYDFFADMQAPYLDGVYQSIWMMRNIYGTPFGDRVWAGITVQRKGITPTPTTAPDPGITFSASPQSVSPGQSVAFSWYAPGANYTYFGLTGAMQPVANPGSAVDNPMMPSTYELSAIYPDGKQKSRQVRIDVMIDPGGPVITRFDIRPEGEIMIGDCVDLSWEIVNNVNRVRLLRDGSVLSDGAPEDGSYNDCPPIGSHTYLLEAYNPSKMNSGQQYIKVNDSMPTVIPPTEVPWPTWVPEPTEIPMPTWVPAPTEEPMPTWVPAPTEEPLPTFAPAPTDEPLPTFAPAPTEEPPVILGGDE